MSRTDFTVLGFTSLLTNVLGPDAAELAPAMEQLMKTLETEDANEP